MTESSLRAMKAYLFRATDVIVLAVLLFGLFAFVPKAMAADTLTSVQIRMSEGRPSQAGNWQVVFTTATAISTTGCLPADLSPCFNVVVELPLTGAIPIFTLAATPTIAATVGSYTAAQVATTGTSAVLQSSAGGTSTNLNWIVIPFKSDGTTNIAAATTFTIDITGNKITNPSKTAAAGTGDTYTVGIVTTKSTPSSPTDSAATRVEINDAVAVSATIADTLSVVRAGTQYAANNWLGDITESGSSYVIDTSGNATTCPFGTLVPNHSYVCGFKYTISTNSENGYQYYVYKLATMTDGTNNIVDFNNGAIVNQASAAVWTDPYNDPNNANTFGHLAYTSDDSSLFTQGTAATQKFAGVSTKVGASTAITAAGLFADGSAAVSSNVNYLALRLMVGALQPNGAYTVTLTDSISAKY